MNYRSFFAVLLCVTSISAQAGSGWFVNIANSNVDDITGIEFREAEENVWETKRVAVADGFEIGPPWESKVGYRFAGDDSSTTVWLFNSSSYKSMATSTWTSNDTSVLEPLVAYDFHYDITFPDSDPNPTPYPTSDVWTNGPFFQAPWAPISVTAYREIAEDSSCSDPQNITIGATDANGAEIITSITAVDSVSFTILEDAVFPVTVTATAEVGEVTIVLEGQEALQVLIATGTGDVPTQSLYYDLNIDLCPPTGD